MRRTYILSLLLFLHISTDGFGQCSITAPNSACEGEVVELKAVSTKTIDSVFWDLGDQSTAKQKTLNHIYNTSGSVTIKLKVYSNGDSCEITKKIQVYAAPDLNASIAANSEYCFSENRICINDSTKKGSSGGKITKQTILWGDGARSLKNNPSYPNQVCYSYKKSGSFSITIQEENQYGCVAEKVVKVEIKKDFPVNFTNKYIKETCFDETHLFRTDSANINSSVDSFVWDWGDGTFERSDFDSVRHTFKAKGTYLVELRIYSKNGCVNRSTRNIVIDFPEIQIITTISDDTVCVNETVVLEASKDYGQEWEWTVIHLQSSEQVKFDGRLNYFSQRTPGTYQIGITINDDQCTKSKVVDTIEVVGIKPEFSLLNGAQCGANDTVYACNTSTIYGTTNYSFFWDFGDSLSGQCTTDLSTGNFLDSNCNYWRGQHAKHFYPDTTCTQVKLYTYDHQNGCIDSLDGSVTLLLTGKEHFRYEAKRKCTGTSRDNSIHFLRKDCLQGIKVNYDSACGKDLFKPFFDYYNYNQTCDSSGKVTVGFAVHTGDGKIYQSCDTTDFIISDRNTCIDTVWFHHWFTLQPPPDPSFYIDTNERCVPTDIKFSLYEPHQKNVKEMTWNWDDGTTETVTVKENYDSLPNGYHLYKEEQRYRVILTMVTDSGCKEQYIKLMSLGYYNDFFLPNDTCVGDSFVVVDSLHYWYSSQALWRDTTYDKVGLSWDFDDGRGFATKGPLPKIAYQNPGKYTIRMASFDEWGCFDTTEHEIVIECVDAGIKKQQQKLLCGGIVRFRDSSSTKLGFGRITSHYWDFGDQTTSSELQNPFHYYRKFGSFTVTHIVGTENNCFDTAYYQMVVEGPTSSMAIVGDSVDCAPFTAEFENNSINASRYIWEFGDSANLKWTTFSDTNVHHTYTQPGTYYVRLLALDSIWDDQSQDYIYCESYYPDSINHPGIFKKIVVLEQPEVDFEIPETVCKGQTVTLVDKSDSVYSNYIWELSNGDKVISANDTAFYTFNDTGTFVLTYKPEYTVLPPLMACPDSMSKTVSVHAIEAIFDYKQEENCPVFTFTNQSAEADSVRWDLGDPEAENHGSTANSIRHDFKTNDSEFKVCLEAWNKEGCRDTTCQIISSESVFDLFVPNVFTPNDDDFNNEFEIEIKGESVYELRIYNRWGNLIYESFEDSELGEGKNWDGINPSNGLEYPEGVYFFIFKYELDCDGEEGEVQGTITLIR